MSTPAPVITVVRVIGIAVTVVAVVLGAVGAANSFARSSVSESFTVRDVETLTVAVDAGRITVERADGDAVEVAVTAEGTWRTPETTRTQDGTALALEARCSDFVLGRCGVRYSVAVPDGVDVELTVGAGRLSVSGVDGDVTARVAAGRIELTGLRSSRVAASSDVGRVVVEAARAPSLLQATTATGEVEVLLPASGAPYDVDATTDVGSARVDVPVDADSPRRVVARSDVGDVTVTTG